MFPNDEFMEKTQTCNSLFTGGKVSQLDIAAVGCLSQYWSLPFWHSAAVVPCHCFLPVGWMHFVAVLYICHGVGEWVFVFTAFNTSSAPFILLLSLGKSSSSSEHSVIWFLILREVFWSLGFGAVFQEFRTWVLVVGLPVWHRTIYLLSAPILPHVEWRRIFPASVWHCWVNYGAFWGSFGKDTGKLLKRDGVNVLCAFTECSILVLMQLRGFGLATLQWNLVEK